MQAQRHYSVFAHVVAEKAPLYRAVLAALVAARGRFAIALRPAEIAADVSEAEEAAGRAAPSLAEIEAALHQLRDWGNLEDAPDTAEVASIEDFYRQRRIYQLSAAGEAAERALQQFDEFLARPGELQTTALHDIMALLDGLPALLVEEPLDEARIHLAFQQLCDRFEDLTSRAQSFMRDLQRRIDLQGLGIDDFLAYKQRLIDYLERFIGELTIASNLIAEALLALPEASIQAACAAAARRECSDALDRSDETLERATRHWLERWAGLRRWFVGEGSGAVAQAELLRSRARTAIPALLATIGQINERRTSRADRAADWMALARWFAEAPDEENAHALWRAAFALTPARHWRINEETLQRRAARPDENHRSWLEAEPMWVSARLRKSGRQAASGPAPTTIDRSAAKAHLALLAQEQARQLEEARSRLVGRGRLRLGELESLEETSFALFLELLGQALARRGPGETAVEANSADGTLRLRLEPIPDAPWVTLRTTHGAFSGPDHWIEIETAV